MRCIYCNHDAEYVGLNHVENCSNPECQAYGKPESDIFYATVKLDLKLVLESYKIYFDYDEPALEWNDEDKIIQGCHSYSSKIMDNDVINMNDYYKFAKKEWNKNESI